MYCRCFSSGMEVKCIYYGRNNIEGYCNFTRAARGLATKAPSVLINVFCGPEGLHTTVCLAEHMGTLPQSH